MDQAGNLGRESKGRAEIASHLFKKCNANYIITLGCDYRNDSNKKISDQMKKFIILKHQIKAELIISESRARDTVGDAVYTMLAIKELNLEVTTIYIVTSDYHQERALEIFKFILGKRYIILSPLTFKTNPLLKRLAKKYYHEKRSMEAFIDTFAEVKQGDSNIIYSTLISKHPYYNGQLFSEIVNDSMHST